MFQSILVRTSFLHETTSLFSLPLFWFNLNVRLLRSSLSSSIDGSICLYWLSYSCRDACRASAWAWDFFCLNGYLKCDDNEFMNSFLCCMSVMGYFNLPFNYLNLWSISQTASPNFCLISIISFIYWSSKIGLRNSLISSFFTSVMVICAPCGLFTARLINQSSAWLQNIIVSWATFVSSSVICLASQIFSQ